MFFETVDRRNVRMIQRRQQLRLALEAREPIGVMECDQRKICSRVGWSHGFPRDLQPCCVAKRSPFTKTMVRLSDAQRRPLADKLFDIANVAAGALIFGQALSERPFSVLLVLVGIVIWLFVSWCAVTLAGGSRP